MELVRIRSAAVVSGTTLRLILTDGSIVERDVGPLLSGPVFERLREDPTVFAAVRVEFGTLVWPGDVDLDPDVLIWGGAAPHDAAARPAKTLRLQSPGSDYDVDAVAERPDE